MVKYLLYPLFSLCLCSSLQLHAQHNYIDSLGQKQGEWIKYEQGKKVYEGFFVNNQPQGRFLRYYPDGRLMAKMNYVPNSAQVYTEIYYPKSHLKRQAKGKYIGKAKDSLWQYFTPQGHLQSEGSYSLDKKEGLWKFYEQGRLVHAATYRADSLDGKQCYYNANGQISKETYYQAQERHGSFRLYYTNGYTRVLGQYVHGEPDGSWQYFNDDGSLQYQEIYAKGKRIKRCDVQGRPYHLPTAETDTTDLKINPYEINLKL